MNLTANHLVAFLITSALAIFTTPPVLAELVTPLPVVSAPDGFAPHLAATSDGQAVMSWLETAGNGHALRFAVLGEEQWGATQTVASGSNWFANWADFPSVVPIKGDFWLAHWLVSQPAGGYAYDIAVSISNDAGKTWGEPVTPHNDFTSTEHGFVSIFSQHESAGLIWLDGRNMPVGGVEHGVHGTSEGMTLRSAHITADTLIEQRQQVDGLVCDCCQTDIAVADSGPVAVYRNRTKDEIRDIYFTRLLDGHWSPGRPVTSDNWEISGCPVNGPAIAIRGERLVVAWYTGAQDQPIVKLAFSREQGDGFQAAIEIDSVNPLGAVDVLLLENGDAVISWLGETADGQAQLRLQRVSPSGERGTEHKIAATSLGRMTGFPQMLVAGEKIVLAWTDRVDEKKVVNSAWVPLGSIK
jgi:hypothetical protein